MNRADYWDNLDRHVGGSGIDEIWLNHPRVRAEANRRISGSDHRWPTDWLRGELRDRLPLGYAASIGCGTGAFERDLIEKKIVNAIVGVDAAHEAVRRARELAESAGLAETISYAETDAKSFLTRQGRVFDAVFFHSSLHHFDDPEDLLACVRRALKPGGLLYLDEYVGPSRDSWTALKLLPANVAYYALPRRIRRPRVVRAPINAEDKTEAIASEKIVGAVETNFDIIARRDYGGNLLSVIYPNMRRPDQGVVTPSEFDRAVRRLLFFERQLLRWPGVSSYYTVVLARAAGEEGIG